MPPIAQRLREPAAFVLLGYGAISTLFNTITFLFGPGSDGSTFSYRAYSLLNALLNPLVTGSLVGAVILAHVVSQLKAAKIISLIALITAAVQVLFGLVALFSAFGVDSQAVGGWGKTVTFFVGAAELAIAGLGGWLLLGYFQQHGPVRPAPNPYAQPPQGQWQQQPPQQWQPPQTNAPAQQPWGPPPAGAPPQQPPQQQAWGAPPPAAPQGFNPADSMATQAIPAMPQQPHPPQQQAPPQQGGQPEQFPPIGNWTSEG